MARKRRVDRQILRAFLLAAISWVAAGANARADEVPPPTFYTIIVRPHDTVSSIATRYDTSNAAIARLNGLGDGCHLYAGEVLRVPALSRRTRDAVLDEAANALIRNYAAPPRPIHVWKLESAHVSVRPLASPPPVEEEAEISRYRGVHHARLATVHTDAEVVHHGVAPRRAPQEEVVASARRGRFVWPIVGRVISAFGDTGYGERNDGINIAARVGAPIHAAGAGTVRYAGDKLKGYGNLVLIQHDDGYVTAYAHAESLTVSQGDHVDTGQIIGYAGATGDVDRPQLHFEIRRGIKPVNPRLLLGTQPLIRLLPNRRGDRMSA